MMSVFWKWHSVSCVAVGMAIGFLLSIGLLVPFDNRTLTFTTKWHNVLGISARGDQQNIRTDRSLGAIRILCLIKTTGENHRTKADHVVVTWARRCNKLLFVSDTLDDKWPMIHANVTHGRDALTDKLRIGVDNVYKHHLDNFDWFLIVDDDAYVVMENLRQLLASHDTNNPIYFGHLHKLYGTNETFFHGGNGYVMSREALRRFGARDKDIYGDTLHYEGDDVEMGRAMRQLGVTFGDSLDSQGLLRFYCEAPEVYLLGPIPSNMYNYEVMEPRTGMVNVSKHAIAFHHLSANHMYMMEYFLYHLVPHGRRETQ